MSAKINLRNDYFLLILLWIILTAININKAFHIDDTFYLEAAEHLISHPTQPMSGLINWGNDPTPMYTHNQPPLFFFLIAGVIKIFGMHEYVLHILLSIFTFFSLFFFQKITKLLSTGKANVLLILFALNPAFIINQNIMTDVPILALVVGSLYFLLKGTKTGKVTDYILASVFIGLGLLIKYSVLPLIIVFILIISIRGDYKKLLVLLIPVGMLLLWSIWNYWEFGAIHLIDRPKDSIHINKLWAYIACLGAISTFLPSFLYGVFANRKMKAIIYVFFIVIIVSIVVLYLIDFQEEQISNYVNILFLIIGFLVVVSLMVVFVKHIKENLIDFIHSDQFSIFLYLTSISSFIILFAPFTATRHILLSLPFILLFGSQLVKKGSKGIIRLSVFITLLLGLLLGVSDWKNADYYRRMASAELLQDRPTWTIGHLGWQWYAKKNGMKVYSTSYSNVNEGDYIVFPVDIPRQELNDDIDLIVIEKKWEEADMFTFFSGNNFASLYYSNVNKAPWNLSKRPIDTIYFCRIAPVNSNTSDSLIEMK